MITTIKALIKAKGFKPYKKYEVDAWIGEYSIWGSTYCHATSIVMLEDGDVFVQYDKTLSMFSNNEKEQENDRPGQEILHIGLNGELCYAASKVEILTDHEKKVYESKENVRCLKAEAKRCLEELAEPLKALFYDDIVDISHIFEDVEGLQVLRDILREKAYKKYDIDLDLAGRLEFIYREHLVTFFDADNNNASVTINLDHLDSIRFCTFDSEFNAVVITIGDNEYRIFEEHNEDVYHALCILYGDY